MKIYDEETLEELYSPDLSAGYTYPSRRKIGTERRTHAGTIELYPPNGLQYDVPVYEECLLYHTYTEDELAAMQNPEVPTDVDARVTALEEELAVAKILLGVE